MIEADLFTRLTSAIGTDVGTRIYPGIAPLQFTAPLAVYNCVSTQVEHTISEGALDYLHTHVQVDIYATTYGSAKSIAKKVRQSLASWTVPVSVHVDDAGTDMIENTVEPNLYRVSMRFILDHNDA